MTDRETVFVTGYQSGVFHTDRSCHNLQRATTVREVDRDAQEDRRGLCSRCAGEDLSNPDQVGWRWNDAGDDAEEVPGGD